MAKRRRTARPKLNLRALLSREPERDTRRRRTIEDNPALQAIWDVVARIPRGRVSTYGDVAREAGLPGRARQAG
jgi:O6-methylguanine-DNA--protein-cysteine methyltransferase